MLPRHEVMRVTVVIAFIYNTQPGVLSPVLYQRCVQVSSRFILNRGKSGLWVLSICDNVARENFSGEQIVSDAQLCQYQGGRELELDNMANTCESLQAL